MNQKLSPTCFWEFSDEVFRSLIEGVILDVFKGHIKDNYYLSELISTPSGNWVVKLERTLESYSRGVTEKQHTQETNG